jgi:predicted flavoprotein YhiN
VKIAIIGGGASGLACAVEAGQKAAEKGVKAEITVYEAKERVGKKILATGNGRCNMMNINDCNYFGDNTFAKSVLQVWMSSSAKVFREDSESPLKVRVI